MYNPVEDEEDLTPEEAWEAAELYNNMVEAMLELDDRNSAISGKGGGGGKRR